MTIDLPCRTATVLSAVKLALLSHGEIVERKAGETLPEINSQISRRTYTADDCSSDKRERLRLI